MHPQAMPRPVLQAVELQIPLIINGPSAALEEKHLRAQMLAYEASDGGLFNPAEQAQLDKTVLHMIKAAISANATLRALELSTLLQLRKSVDIAITLANHFKKQTLAERISLVMQSKFRGGLAQAVPEAAPEVEQHDLNTVDLSVLSAKPASEPLAAVSSARKRTTQMSLTGEPVVDAPAKKAKTASVKKEKPDSVAEPAVDAEAKEAKADDNSEAEAEAPVAKKAKKSDKKDESSDKKSSKTEDKKKNKNAATPATAVRRSPRKSPAKAKVPKGANPFARPGGAAPKKITSLFAAAAKD